MWAAHPQCAESPLCHTKNSHTGFRWTIIRLRRILVECNREPDRNESHVKLVVPTSWPRRHTTAFGASSVPWQAKTDRRVRVGVRVREGSRGHTYERERSEVYHAGSMKAVGGGKKDTTGIFVAFHGLKGLDNDSLGLSPRYDAATHGALKRHEKASSMRGLYNAFSVLSLPISHLGRRPRLCLCRPFGTSVGY